jgi:hypothetical protein
MLKNTFLTTPDVKKYIFGGHVSGGLEVCAYALKHVLTTSDVKKYQFEKQFLLVWKYAQMH